MKKPTLIVVLIGGLMFMRALAQSAPTQTEGWGPPPLPSGPPSLYTGSLSGPTWSSGKKMVLSSNPPTITGVAKYPPLFVAMQSLQEGYNALFDANAMVPVQYLVRSMAGIDKALADVRVAVEVLEGEATPALTSLPKLPEGLGNENFPEIVKPSTAASSSNLETAISFLHTAQDALRKPDPSTSGINIAHALIGIQFALDNANAAVNLANGLPATQLRPTPPHLSFSAVEVGGALLVIVILIVVVEEIVRAKRGH